MGGNSSKLPVYEAINAKLFPSALGLKFKLSDGRNLGYAEYGAVQSRNVILFIPGIPGTRLFHHPNVKLLEELDIRMVVVERPGFGFSDRKDDLTFVSFASDVEELLASFDIERFGVLGFSAGTPWALAVAHKLPDRVTNVAIVSSLAPKEAPHATQGMPFVFKLATFLAQSAPSVLAQICKQLGQDYLKAPVKTGRDDWSRYHKVDQEIYTQPEIEQLFLESALETYSQRGWVAEAKEYAKWFRPWGFELTEIRSKVGVWHGALDQGTTRAMSEYLVAKIPNCEKFFSDNEGHLLFFAHYEEIIRFIIG